MEQARSARAGDKQVAREGNDDGLGMGPGGGEVVLLYLGYISRCRCEGYGFQAVYSRIGYINSAELALVPAAHPLQEIPKYPPPQPPGLNRPNFISTGLC